MNLHLLRIFVSVVDFRGFSRAAEALHISQPAVSKAVRELEHQLGLPLLERSGGRGRGIQLTTDGESLYRHARGIFALERAAIEDIRDRVKLRKGRLNVGASTTVAGYWLAAPLARFSLDYPGVELELKVGNTAQIAKAILDGEVDMAVVEGEVKDPALEVTHWREEPLCVVAAADAVRPRSLQELAEWTWLIREAGSGTAQVTERTLALHQMDPKRRMLLGSNEAIANAAAAGAGCALLPEAVVRDLLALGRLSVLDIPELSGLSRDLFRLELRDRPRAPVMQAMWARLDVPV